MLAIAGVYLNVKLEIFFNLLLALILDIVIVAVVKAFTRRRRPSYNYDDQHATLKAIDKFSFPSGHATRSVLLCVFFAVLYPAPLLLWILIAPVLILWSGSVCVSRVLLARHHLLDCVAGVLIGFLEAGLLSCLWLGPERAQELLNMVGGEDPWSSA